MSITPFPNPIHTFHKTTHRTLYDSVLSKQTSLLYPQLPFDFVSTTVSYPCFTQPHTEHYMILCCHSKLAHFTLNYPLCQPLRFFLSMFHTTTHRTLHDSVSSKRTSLLYSQLPFVSTTPVLIHVSHHTQNTT